MSTRSFRARVASYFKTSDMDVEGRYGRSRAPASLWEELRLGLIVLGFCASAYQGHRMSETGEEFVQNLELNRKKFYKLDFEPRFVDTAPTHGVYDRVTTYSFEDSSRNLAENADKRIVAPNRVELRQNVEKNLKVTPEMIEKVKRLREHYATGQGS